MADRLPLSALLSQALVAFTIEFDNEFEHQAPHRTTNFGATSASVPWLVSRAIWIKFLRFVPAQGIRVEEFQRRAGLTNKETKIWLTRLSQWWDYVVVQKDATEIPRHWLIRPTSGGQKALDIWRPLDTVVEKRWQARFGSRTVEKLRRSMQSLTNQFNPELPDSLPILGFDMLSVGPDPELCSGTASEHSLPTLLSKVLLAFAIRFEHESRLSLAISANVLRLASEEGLRVRDLPRLSGVSKEAIAMAIKRLESSGLAIVQPEQNKSRVKALSLTEPGLHAPDTYRRLVSEIEKHWETGNLRQSLEACAPDLWRGLEPYPDGWRASLPRPDTLPHYPMILHRGGFPDGS